MDNKINLQSIQDEIRRLERMREVEIGRLQELEQILKARARVKLLEKELEPQLHPYQYTAKEAGRKILGGLARAIREIERPEREEARARRAKPKEAYG